MPRIHVHIWLGLSNHLIFPWNSKYSSLSDHGLTVYYYYLLKVPVSQHFQILLKVNISFDSDISGVLQCWLKEVRPGLDHWVFHAEIVQKLGV